MACFRAHLFTSPFILLLALTFIINRCTAQPIQCHAECTKVGNCNQDTGKCECPFGRSGDRCEIDLLSACRLHPEGTAHCGFVALRPCQCLQQCFDYLCPKINGTDDSRRCNVMNFPDHRTSCFERTALGDKQTGQVPKEDEKGVIYYDTFIPGQQKNITYDQAILRSDGKEEVVPHSECPNECSLHGVCLRAHEEKKGMFSKGPKPYCTCHYGYDGDDCSTEINLCVNQCSERGKCSQTFCHCEKDSWGFGCHREKAFPRTGGVPHPTDFKIYIYNLPMHIANEVGNYAGFWGHDQIYTAYRQFNDRLAASAVITENPEEANFFYIPAFTYHYTSNLGNPESHLTAVLEYVQQQYPWWNRTDGRDHIVWTSGDRSSCYTQSSITRKPIKLTHFGYFDNNDNGNAKMIISSADGIWGCYHPLRDVAMPPQSHNDLAGWAHDVHIQNSQTPDEAWNARKTLMFFAGGFRDSDVEYSGGARHAVKKYHNEKWKKDKDIVIAEGYVGDYFAKYKGSKYCLAMYGHGFGTRLVESMASGCVPVIIQDHVFQYYEHVLPYEDFSIRLNNDDIEHLPDILRSISEEEYKKLYAAVQQYYPAFVWSEHGGGRAFDFALLAIRRRWLNFKSLYYGRHDAGKFL